MILDCSVGTSVIILLVFMHFVVECDGEGYCSFPTYLWQPVFVDTTFDAPVKPRQWISKSEYHKNTNKWRKQKEIVAREKEILISHKIHASCDAYHRHPDDRCYKKSNEYHLICVSEEAGGKFRIRQEIDGKFTFTCVQFVARTSHVVQVYSAAPKDENEDSLCLDRALQRDEWPWIAADILGVEPCPFTGGFDFAAFERTQRKRICPNEWRPSRFESECVEGEAISFFAPSEDCSLFFDQPTELKLQCWGHWSEASYLFILLGENSHLPRFVLRLPKDFGMHPGQETVFLYFSLVMPLGGHGNAPGTVLYNELRTQRSESGLCYDVAEKCSTYAKQGKCVNSALHRYANYCRKSCGLCDFAPTTNHECVFPAEIHGTWVVFWAGKSEELTISDGNITTSTLGTYVCKGKHWQKNYYKVFSAYDNGCRSRYSCLQLTDLADDLLQMRISHSALIDESFSICKFEEQTIAPTGLLRNGALHTLLRKPIVKLGSCGIHGTVAINATFSNWVNCVGTLSDLDLRTCMRVNQLLFRFDACSLRTVQSLSCVAYAQLPNGATFIVTEDHGVSRDYICWVARSDSNRGTFSTIHPFQMSRAECSTGSMVYPLPDSKQLTVIKASSAISEEACGYHNEPHWLQRSPSIAQLDSVDNRIATTALPEVGSTRRSPEPGHRQQSDSVAGSIVVLSRGQTIYTSRILRTTLLILCVISHP